MLGQRIKKLLIDENANLVHFPEITGHLSQDGAFKLVRYGLQSFDGIDESKSSAPFAYSVHEGEFATDESRENALNAQRLLREKKVPVEFVLRCLFLSSDGKQISCKGDIDLAEFRMRNTHALSINQYRKIIGQLVLGLFDLHSRNLVHRDVRLENVVLFAQTTNVVAQLIDLDDLQEVETQGRAIGRCLPAGAKAYLSKEYRDAKKADHLDQLNLKAVDIFALGKLVSLAKRMLDKSVRVMPEYHQLLRLCLKMKNHNAVTRPTIVQVMANPFFGATQKIREAFFAGLRRAAMYAAFQLDNKPVPRTKPDDASNVISDPVKRKMYQAAWSFADELDDARSCFLPARQYRDLVQLSRYTAWLQEKANTLIAMLPPHDEFAKKIQLAVIDDMAAFADLNPADEMLLQRAIGEAVLSYQKAQQALRKKVASPALFTAFQKEPVDEFYSEFRMAVREGKAIDVYQHHLYPDEKTEYSLPGDFKNTLIDTLESLPLDVRMRLKITVPPKQAAEANGCGSAIIRSVKRGLLGVCSDR